MELNLAFVHGSGYTHESFDAQKAVFADARAVRLPGHPVGMSLTTVAACSEWLARDLALASDVQWVVAGNSLGGAIAMRWALDFPEQAKALILIGSGARLRVSHEIFTMIEDGWPACIPELTDLALSAKAPADLRHRVVRWHEAVGRENTRRDYAACNDFDVMQEVQRLRLPVLIIVGSEDRMTPLKYSQYLHDRIKGSRLMALAGAGHLAMAENPAQVNAAIREFLSAL